MLYSRVSLVNDIRLMNAILQDTYEVHDDDDCSNDASLDNFYDAPTEGGGLGEVRINMDPTERLCEAIEGLREVIVDNTSAQAKRRGGGGGAGGGGRRIQGIPATLYKSSGPMAGLKDERLKIRKDKVRQHACYHCQDIIQ